MRQRKELTEEDFLRAQQKTFQEFVSTPTFGTNKVSIDNFSTSGLSDEDDGDLEGFVVPDKDDGILKNSFSVAGLSEDESDIEIEPQHEIFKNNIMDSSFISNTGLSDDDDDGTLSGDIHGAFVQTGLSDDDGDSDSDQEYSTDLSTVNVDSYKKSLENEWCKYSFAIENKKEFEFDRNLLVEKDDSVSFRIGQKEGMYLEPKGFVVKKIVGDSPILRITAKYGFGLQGCKDPLLCKIQQSCRPNLELRIFKCGDKYIPLFKTLCYVPALTDLTTATPYLNIGRTLNLCPIT